MTFLSLNDDRYLSADQLAWNLKAPCGDCPFRRDAPDHGGVAASLPFYIEVIRDGRFAHTCHKTDNRLECDGPRKYNGQTEHCAGALHFLIREKLDLQSPLAKAIDAGQLDIHEASRRARADESVFGSLDELVNYYIAVCERELERRRVDPDVVCAFIDGKFNEEKKLIPLSEARAGKAEIVECRTCGKPANEFDSQWPYAWDHSFCYEHAGDGLAAAARDLNDAI